jgi:uncharacterized protein YbbC (DUF1343 family)
MGTDKVRKKFSGGESADDIIASWEADLLEFSEERRRYLIY